MHDKDVALRLPVEKWPYLISDVKGNKLLILLSTYSPCRLLVQAGGVTV
jgi:hypothetical protein